MEGVRLRLGRVGQVRPLEAQSGKGLTARPAESEATWNGEKQLTKLLRIRKTGIFLFTNPMIYLLVRALTYRKIGKDRI
ncbi:hypothetical protein ABE65_020120 [Fictibacillus phosphorivorans]|uniref:Uncharacterized protein n=1 Tax=Fictibacillus phosphorivorans TaxID=1221500 RepID=A0A160IR54_9BACL|nr:hypothetical protein ABE65_020120 [Fictibacillus phosphorivorans]